jgi:hypothetical protein
LKELYPCKICNDTFEVEHHHTTCVKLPESCKSLTGECFLKRGKRCPNLMKSSEESDMIKKIVYGGILLLLVTLMILLLASVLVSCNFSVNLVHSGDAGSVDEVDEASPDVKPNVNLTSVPAI